MATNELELYDRAMFEFFQVVKEDCKTPVPSVFAPPQRAFAALKDLFETQGVVVENNRVPLPATALHRDMPTFNPALYRFTDRWIARYDNPPDHKKVKVTGPPQSVTIPYVLEIWTYTQIEMLSILKQLSMKFRGELAYSVVDLREYGPKRFSIRNDGITDASNLEPQEEERTLRTTMNVTLNAVLHQPLETVRTVHIVETEIRELETDELLGSSEVTVDDV